MFPSSRRSNDGLRDAGSSSTAGERGRAAFFVVVLVLALSPFVLSFASSFALPFALDLAVLAGFSESDVGGWGDVVGRRALDAFALLATEEEPEGADADAGVGGDLESDREA